MAVAVQAIEVGRGDDLVAGPGDVEHRGTWTLFSQTPKQFGVAVRFVDPADPENFRRATDDKTRAYYAKILPDPKLNVVPIREVADIGRAFGVPLIADNTATPLIDILEDLSQALDAAARGSVREPPRKAA